MARFEPDDPELASRLEEAWTLARERGGSDKAQVRGWLFHLLYNEEEGVYGNRKGNRFRLSWRELMERLIVIVNKETRTVPLVLNPSQRMTHARVLRAIRKGQPIRIVILKVRQNGISTYIIALWLILILTRPNTKAQIITHEKKLYAELLGRLRSAFRRLRQEDGKPWDLPTTSLSRDLLEFGEPFHSAVNVITAGADSPGFGQTPTLVDMEETSKWPKAEDKAKGILLGVPMVGGSIVFDVSQPNGNTGYFADKFKSAWARENEQPDPTLGKTDAMLAQDWDPLFMPWFMHPEYRHTRIGGNPPVMLPALEAHIRATLDSEEKVLLVQRYYERGYPGGWRQVDIDQIAWRRVYIQKVLQGSLAAFHEQCPAFPEEAFLSSGHPFFNSDHIRRAMVEHQEEPEGVGELVKDGEAILFSDRENGCLRVWKHPEPGHRYAIGVDTAAGVRGGDPCVAEIVDVDTEEQVAEWYGWEPPHTFAWTVTMLSDYYEADMAIETHPSPHGLTVFNYAEDYGCERLLVQQVPDARDNRWQTRRGWVMSAQTKNECHNRVKLALEEGAVIRSRGLLQEMLDARLDEKDKFDDECRNDRVVSYGIAQKLADKIRTEQVKPKKADPGPEPGTAEAYWEEQRLQEPPKGARPSARPAILNGFGL